MAKTIQEKNQMECNKKAREKYHKEKTKSIAIRLMISTESDIIEKLDSVENKAGYIKKLIREDINKNF